MYTQSVHLFVLRLHLRIAHGGYPVSNNTRLPTKAKLRWALGRDGNKREPPSPFPLLLLPEEENSRERELNGCSFLAQSSWTRLRGLRDSRLFPIVNCPVPVSGREREFNLRASKFAKRRLAVQVIRNGLSCRMSANETSILCLNAFCKSSVRSGEAPRFARVLQRDNFADGKSRVVR